MNLGRELHLVNIFLKFNLITRTILPSMFPSRLLVQFFPLIGAVVNTATIARYIVIIFTSTVSILNDRGEGTLTVFWVVHIFLLLLHHTLLFVHLSTIDQVILVRHASFLNFLFGEHLFVDLLRLGIHCRLCVQLGAFVATSVHHSLLLPLHSLQLNVICTIEAKLFELLVHLLYFLLTQHVLSCLLINCANELWVGIASACLSSERVAQYGGKEDSKMCH